MSASDHNARIIEEFRANDGVVGGAFAATPLLLLHHTGARSGEARISPVACLRDDDRFVIFASKGGAPVNPGWYYNLKAHADVTIEFGTDSIPVTAAEATGEERERLFNAQVQRAPQFGEYAANTDRTIPVMVLTRR
jgi:deazaflavin-dependent oxidoreductase (nitroreductase family)